MRILAIIPAYNEEASIGMVVRRIRSSIPEADVLVVNDGSTDNTFINASNAGATIVNLPFNLGIGGAVQTGYLYAQQNAYDAAVQVDGDGQHDPAYICKLLEPLAAGSADMVIGSRYVAETAYKSSIFRRTGMIFFSTLINALTGQKVTDTTSGFRAVNRKVIDFFADFYPSDYPEVDVLVRLHKKKFKVMEVPVEMKERQGGKSSITPFRSIYYMIKVSLSLLVGSMRSYEE